MYQRRKKILPVVLASMVEAENFSDYPRKYEHKFKRMEVFNIGMARKWKKIPVGCHFCSASGHVTFVCLPHGSCVVREVLTALFLSFMLCDAG